jgi:hypothetical protein
MGVDAITFLGQAFERERDRSSTAPCRSGGSVLNARGDKEDACQKRSERDSEMHDDQKQLNKQNESDVYLRAYMRGLPR